MSNSIALLPAGQDSEDFELSCQMRVFDSYDAYSSLNKTVNVKKHQLSNSDYKKIGKRKSIFVQLINFFTLFVFLSFSLSFFLSFILFRLLTNSLIIYYFSCLTLHQISILVQSAASESDDVESLLQIVLSVGASLDSVTCLGASPVCYMKK